MPIRYNISLAACNNATGQVQACPTLLIPVNSGISQQAQHQHPHQHQAPPPPQHQHHQQQQQPHLHAIKMDRDADAISPYLLENGTTLLQVPFRHNPYTAAGGAQADGTQQQQQHEQPAPPPPHYHPQQQQHLYAAAAAGGAGAAAAGGAGAAAAGTYDSTHQLVFFTGTGAPATASSAPPPPMRRQDSSYQQHPPLPQYQQQQHQPQQQHLPTYPHPPPPPPQQQQQQQQQQQHYIMEYNMTSLSNNANTAAPGGVGAAYHANTNAHRDGAPSAGAATTAAGTVFDLTPSGVAVPKSAGAVSMPHHYQNPSTMIKLSPVSTPKNNSVIIDEEGYPSAHHRFSLPPPPPPAAHLHSQQQQQQPQPQPQQQQQQMFNGISGFPQGSVLLTPMSVNTPNSHAQQQQQQPRHQQLLRNAGRNPSPQPHPMAMRATMVPMMASQSLPQAIVTQTSGMPHHHSQHQQHVEYCDVFEASPASTTVASAAPASMHGGRFLFATSPPSSTAGGTGSGPQMVTMATTHLVPASSTSSAGPIMLELASPNRTATHVTATTVMNPPMPSEEPKKRRRKRKARKQHLFIPLPDPLPSTELVFLPPPPPALSLLGPCAQGRRALIQQQQQQHCSSADDFLCEVSTAAPMHESISEENEMKATGQSRNALGFSKDDTKTAECAEKALGERTCDVVGDAGAHLTLVDETSNLSEVNDISNSATHVCFAPLPELPGPKKRAEVGSKRAEEAEGDDEEASNSSSDENESHAVTEDVDKATETHSQRKEQHARQSLSTVVGYGLVSINTFFAMLNRWYERTLAAEDDYVRRALTTTTVTTVNGANTTTTTTTVTSRSLSTAPGGTIIMDVGDMYNEVLIPCPRRELFILPSFTLQAPPSSYMGSTMITTTVRRATGANEGVAACSTNDAKRAEEEIYELGRSTVSEGDVVPPEEEQAVRNWAEALATWWTDHVKQHTRGSRYKRTVERQRRLQAQQQQQQQQQLQMQAITPYMTADVAPHYYHQLSR